MLLLVSWLSATRTSVSPASAQSVAARASMADSIILSCTSCGNTEEEDMWGIGPEYCECCEMTLCDRCYSWLHVF